MSVTFGSGRTLSPRLGRQIGNPVRNLSDCGIRVKSAGLGNVSRFDESFRFDLSELVVYRAAEMDWFLSKRHTRSAIGEVPLENRQADTGKPMCLPVGVDDELHRNIVRSAAIREFRGRTDGSACRRYNRRVE